MATFREANQVRLLLKMELSQYYWYNSTTVVSDSDGYAVIVSVNQLDNKIRKVIPQVRNGVSIKTELD